MDPQRTDVACKGKVKIYMRPIGKIVHGRELFSIFKLLQVETAARGPNATLEKVLCGPRMDFDYKCDAARILQFFDARVYNPLLFQLRS